jgi:uncharacterized membrane protein
MKSTRRRSDCVLSVEILEDRSLLSANITVLGTAAAGGYKFLNFNGPNAGTNAAAGSNENGISNSGRVVGFDIDNNGNLHNFTVNPLLSPKVQELNINGSTTAMALGVNLFGTVVGNDGNGNAFSLSNGNVHTFIPLGGSAATAFGINDLGQIVGQYKTATRRPASSCPILTRQSGSMRPRGLTSLTPRGSTILAWSSASTSARTARTTASSPTSTTRAPVS